MLVSQCLFRGGVASLAVRSKVAVRQTRSFQKVPLQSVLAAQSANAGRFVDVRSAGAFRDAHAAGFVNVPVDDVATSLASVAKSERVFLIDQYGFYSEKAARSLEAAGFHDVKVVDGGLLYWTFQGGPLASDNPSLAPRLRATEGADKATLASAQANAQDVGVSVDLTDRIFPLLDVHMTDPADREEALAKSVVKRK